MITHLFLIKHSFLNVPLSASGNSLFLWGGGGLLNVCWQFLEKSYFNLYCSLRFNDLTNENNSQNLIVRFNSILFVNLRFQISSLLKCENISFNLSINQFIVLLLWVSTFRDMLYQKNFKNFISKENVWRYSKIQLYFDEGWWIYPCSSSSKLSSYVFSRQEAWEHSFAWKLLFHCSSQPVN